MKSQTQINHHNNPKYYPNQQYQLNSHNQSPLMQPNNQSIFGSKQIKCTSKNYSAKNIQQSNHLLSYQINPSEIYVQTYISEVTNTISLLIDENNQMMSRLANQNQILMCHLKNIRRIVKFQNQSQKNHDHHHKRKHNHNQYYKIYKDQPSNLRQKKQQIEQIETLNIQKNNQEINHINEKFKYDNQPQYLQVKSKKPSKRIVQNKQTSQKQKNISLSNKGAINYSNENWINEQSYVLNFLQGYLKQNIIKTPHNQQNIIDKKYIMQLYIQWKSLQELDKRNDLPAQNVQQILTNQIKAMFECACTSKGFTGLLFKQQQEEQIQIQEGQSSIKIKIQQQ